MSYTCKNCGAEHDSNFCPECGAPHKGLPRRSHAAVVAHNRSCGGGCLISFFILTRSIHRHSFNRLSVWLRYSGLQP